MAEYERYVIGLRYSRRFQMELSVRGQHPKYYQGFNAHEGEIPEAALEMLRAYCKILQDSGEMQWTPTCTTIWDYEPSVSELLTEISKGNVAMLAKMREPGRTEPLRPIVEAFLQKKASFADLRRAIGLD